MHTVIHAIVSFQTHRVRLDGTKREKITSRFLVFETVFSTKSTTAHESVRRCFECSYLRTCYACCTAVNFHGFGPMGRVKVQYSSNSIGSVLLPLTTFPLF